MEDATRLPHPLVISRASRYAKHVVDAVLHRRCRAQVCAHALCVRSPRLEAAQAMSVGRLLMIALNYGMRYSMDRHCGKVCVCKSCSESLSIAQDLFRVGHALAAHYGATLCVTAQHRNRTIQWRLQLR